MLGCESRVILQPMTGTFGRQLLVLEMNEINFDLVKRYVMEHRLPALGALLDGGVSRTTSESEYENLEPWIQWVSAHTGLAAKEHGVFRLGDMVHSQAPQYIEQLEAAGISVGAISPMNTVNRLRRPAYFIPDPWTQTPSDGSMWSRRLTAAIAQAVNDNAQSRISLSTLAWLALGITRFARPKNYLAYLGLALTSRSRPWRRALFLDLYMHDLHYRLWRARRPQYSSLFLNAGAHIQHHYLFNSKAGGLTNPAWYVGADEDPFLDMLKVYDRIAADYQAHPEIGLVVATGLTQRPYMKQEFYWRLKNHTAFLDRIGVAYHRVTPRMTRDFLIEFDGARGAASAQATLEGLRTEAGQPIFGEIENRGDSLFVTLTFDGDVSEGLRVSNAADLAFDLKPLVAFVALKNGMHDGRGFVFYRGPAAAYATAPEAHVAQLYHMVRRYFGLPPVAPPNANQPPPVAAAG